MGPSQRWLRSIGSGRYRSSIRPMIRWYYRNYPELMRRR